MECPSYLEKMDLENLFVLILALGALKNLEIEKNGGLGFQPELYEKYVKEGCPDWTKMYGTKIKTHKIFSLIQESCSEEFREEIANVIDLDLDLQFEKFIEVCEKYNDEIEKAFFKGLKRKRINVFLSCYVVHHILLLPALFGKSLPYLLRNARKGDHDSILKLIQVDKSFIGTKWAMKEIRKAQFSGDQKFLNKIGNSIKKDPWNKNRRKNLYLSFVLVVGWELGLKKLKNLEIHDLVSDLGVYEYNDTESLYKEIKRLKLRKNKREKKVA